MAVPVAVEQAAARVGRICFRLHSVARRATKMLSRHEWQHLCLTAVYLAYAQRGGTPEDMETFAWDNEQFLAEAAAILRVYVTGQASDFVDIHRRNSVRHNGAVNAEVCWDAWRSSGDQEAGDAFLQYRGWSRDDGSPIEAVASEYYNAEDELLETIESRDLLDELFADLARILSPRDVRFLKQRYLDGLDQYEIAAQVIREQPEYQTPDGMRRAVRMVNVAVHRARRRARTLLPPKYAALVSEAA